MLAWMELVACLGIYIVLTHLAMLSALGTPVIHDIVPLMTNNITAWHLSVWFPIIPLAWRSWKGVSTKWLGQLSRLVLMKAILQFVTVVPAPSGMRDCTTSNVFWLFSCANMMFSGQVALTMISLQGVSKRVRVIIVTMQSILLVVAGVHYISDCLVAVLAVLYVETLDIKESSLFPNEYSFKKTKDKLCGRSTRQKGLYEMVSRRERQEDSASPITTDDVPADEQI